MPIPIDGWHPEPVGKQARAAHREERRRAAPLDWPTIATITVVAATAVAGVAWWLLFRITTPTLFSPESATNGSSPAAFAVAISATITGGLPAMFWWRRRLTRRREHDQGRPR